jgi:DNA processing protein
MQDELLYQVALTMLPNIGAVQAKILLQHFEPAEIFSTKKSALEKIEGIGTVRAQNIKSFTGFDKAAAELEFISQYKITPLFITDQRYPQRLLNCYDSPTLLYYRGTADLNATKIVAVIGTRNHTEYGKQQTEKLVTTLASHNITVISGLAFGIDGIAHKTAVKNQAPTVGVLAHGLDQLYPPEHSNLARDMINNGGGLLTEFRKGTFADRHNFPIRNRIVAGMSDATIVIETGIKGGSMITAELANGYNKDVFAYPGKVTDTKSAGCNYLIKTNKATLLTDAEQLLEYMGWQEAKQTKTVKKQKELFIELSNEEKIIVDLLKQKEQTHIDEIHLQSGLSSSAVAAAILNLELQSVITALPGKIYSLL